MTRLEFELTWSVVLSDIEALQNITYYNREKSSGNGDCDHVSVWSHDAYS